MSAGPVRAPLGLPLTPGRYLRNRRSAALLGIDDVAEKLATEPRLAEHARAEWLELIEADVTPATFNTIVALRRAFPFDLQVLAQLAAIQHGADVPAPQLCRICACSFMDPCLATPFGSCSWAEEDLCTACDSRPAIAALAAKPAAATPEQAGTAR